MFNIMKKQYSHYISRLFFSLIFAVFSVGCTIDEEDLKNFYMQQSSIHIISAGELYKEYDVNVVAADLKYRDNAIIVYGVVQDIGKNAIDKAYIIIGGKRHEGIQCFFARKDMASVAGLSKGQFVAIEGKVKSNAGGTIVLDNARILSDEEEENILPKQFTIIGKDTLWFVYTDIMPRFLHQKKPEYPEKARIAGIEGKVFVCVLIGKDGKPVKAIVAKRTPPEQTIFDSSAIEAVMNSTYEPGIRNGKPIEVWLNVPVRYTLR